MKIVLLIAIGVSATVMSFAQSDLQMVPHKPDLTLSGVNSAEAQEPGFYVTAHNQRNGNPTAQMTGQQFSSSHNGFSVTFSHSNCLTANQALGIALFTHRISADWSPVNVNSGYIQGSWWDGNQWDSMYFSNNGSQLFRFPSGAILNGTGNSTVANAWLAIAGPYSNGTIWSGYYVSGGPLTPGFGHNGTGTAVASLNSFPRVDMASYTDSSVWVTGSLLDDDDLTNSPYRGASLNKGTWNGTQITWVMDSIKPSFHTNGAGVADSYQNTHLAFSEDGQIGYCVFFGVQASATTPETRTFNPIVYTTTNGGTTWSSSPWTPNDFTQIPAISSILLPTPAGDFKPWFSQSNGSDIVVDFNNQLHIICTIESGYSDDDDSLGYTWAPSNVSTHFIYDVYTTGANTWNAEFIDTIFTNPTTTQSIFPGTELNARLQASISPGGDHIFYLWADTDPAIAGGENAYPNMFGIGIDWATSMRTVRTQFTFSDDAYFHYNSNVTLVSGSMYTIPSTNSIDRNGSHSMSTTFDHYYLNNVMFDQSVFFYPLFTSIRNATASFGSIEAYPNPATDILNLNVVLNKIEEVTVNMVNLLGETVSLQQYAMNAGSNNIQMSTFNLEAGVYVITVSAGESVATTRVVVQ